MNIIKILIRRKKINLLVKININNKKKKKNKIKIIKKNL